MKFWKKMKDGGAESSVIGYWLIESKPTFSIVLLKFEGASREAYHEHAFNSLSMLLRGRLVESIKDGPTYVHTPGDVILTKRSTFHKVDSDGTSWVLSLRGPWIDRWREWLPLEKRERTLTHGRQEI